MNEGIKPPVQQENDQANGETTNAEGKETTQPVEEEKKVTTDGEGEFLTKVIEQYKTLRRQVTDLIVTNNQVEIARYTGFLGERHSGEGLNTQLNSEGDTVPYKYQSRFKGVEFAKNIVYGVEIGIFEHPRLEFIHLPKVISTPAEYIEYLQNLAKESPELSPFIDELLKLRPKPNAAIISPLGIMFMECKLEKRGQVQRAQFPTNAIIVGTCAYSISTRNSGTRRNQVVFKNEGFIRMDLDPNKVAQMRQRKTNIDIERHWYILLEMTRMKKVEDDY